MSAEGVVLVHGGLHTSTCWSAVVPYLTMPVVAVDLPGRGRRPADLATVTVEDCVQAVIESADEAGFDRFVLVGHSLGGVTVTETAWRYPQRVAKLIYVAALVPAPGANASSVAYGVDLPPGEFAVDDEDLARSVFGNDLSDEQWAVYWHSMVPDAANIMNARLSGYPSGLPDHLCQHVRRHSRAARGGRTDDRQSRCRGRAPGAVGGPLGHDVEAVGTRDDHQRGGRAGPIRRNLWVAYISGGRYVDKQPGGCT